MEKAKKERLFYLDFIRAISIIVIVTYHFSVHFYGQQTTAGYITFLQKGQFGLCGVALFLMISGASLMYNYGEKIDIKKYFKKRFLGIYPSYWICYTIAFLYSFWKYKSLIWNGEFIRIVFSFLGMDGYLAPYFQTFALIGDWFVGCIVLIYILFPIFKLAMEKYPKLFFCIFTLLFFIMIFFSNFKMPLNNDLIISSYSFVLGMYFIKYLKEIKIWQVIIAFVSVVLWFNLGNTIQLWRGVLCGNLLGYNLFIVLAFVGARISVEWVKKIIKYISKYSYCIFLVHHYTILEINSHFSNVTLDKYGTLIVYILSWGIILLLSKIIYLLNKKFIVLFSKSKEV